MQRYRLCAATFLVWLATCMAAFGDVLQVGNRFPDISFWDSDGRVAKFDRFLGKRSVVFVFASW